MRMLVGGGRKDKSKRIPVTNPFDNSVIDEVPRGDASDVEEALATAVRGAAHMRKMPAFDRYLKLRKAAELLEERVEDFGRTISLEEGKIIAEGRFEATRSVQTLIASAEEAKRLYGEVVPLDAAPGGAGKFGFTLRVPCGVVVAITP